jgi:hypothetical protein
MKGTPALLDPVADRLILRGYEPIVAVRIAHARSVKLTSPEPSDDRPGRELREWLDRELGRTVLLIGKHGGAL